MIVMCSVLEKKDHSIRITLMDNDKILLLQECSRNDFCEKLPSMMQDILLFLKKNYNNYIHDIEYVTDFDIKKHLTTYRIFESFTKGLSINKIKI